MADCTQRSSKFWHLVISIDNLGWDCFIEGPIPFSLINTIKPMLCRYKPRGYIKLWGCKFIKDLIGLTHKQWLFRNNEVHYVSNRLRMKQHEEHTAKIKILLKTRHCTLLRCHRTRERPYISTPGMGCQHGNGYKRCQGSNSKLLIAGYLASIEHSICRPKNTTTPHSPFHPLQHSVSFARHPIATNHTTITQTPQLPQPIAIFTS